MGSTEAMLFSLDTGKAFLGKVTERLGVVPGVHEERDFEDGEHKIRPLESVRNRDVFVVQSLYGGDGYSVNDKLIRLLFFLGALRDAGAARLHAVTPYLCYARKDRRTKSRDPVSIRYVAQLMESIGIDTITAMDVHNPAAWENAFRCASVHLSAHLVLIDYFLSVLDQRSVTVASPDLGGTKRASFTLTRRSRISRSSIRSAGKRRMCTSHSTVSPLPPSRNRPLISRTSDSTPR